MPIIPYLSFNEAFILLLPDLGRLEQVVDVFGFPVHLILFLRLHRLVLLYFVINLSNSNSNNAEIGSTVPVLGVYWHQSYTFNYLTIIRSTGTDTIY